MEIIDTNNELEIKELEKRKEELNKKIMQKETLEEQDFALVRTTNHLPENKIIEPINKVPFVTPTNSIASRSYKKLKIEQEGINVFEENEYEKLKEKAKEYTPLSTQYRSTIHFTLNGLVASHDKGNFQNKDFIIIDNLQKHLGKEDFRSIKMEDTFVKEEFKISEDAIILIEESKYEELLKQNPSLQSYQVILYKGNETTAVEIVLTKLGIMPEKINQDYAQYSERTEKIIESLTKISEKYQIEQTKHNLTKEYQEDDEKSLELWAIYEEDFYSKLFDYTNLDEKQKEYLIEELTNKEKQDDEKIEMFIAYIEKIGLETYENFVSKYNNQIIDKINNKEYPNNEEILQNGSLEKKDNQIRI